MRKPTGYNAGKDFRKPCSHVSQLTTLEFDRFQVVMRHDSNSIKYDFISRLRKANLLPGRDELIGVLSAAEMLELDLPASGRRRPGKVDNESSIIELMGVYAPDRKEVVVYDKMCKIVAAGLKLDAETLKRVVAAHEVAHAVTHLGKDEKDRIWYYFDEALEEDTELFAQIYPLFYFRKVKDKQALSVFLKLADHQDDIYNQWRKYEHSDIEDVNDMLMEKRLERADDAYLDTDEGSDMLAFDGMETIVLTQWMKKVRVMIQSSMTTGRIDKKDLDHLKGVIRFCASTIKNDLGPKSKNYLKERYVYLQTDIALLRRSFDAMLDSARRTGS